MTKDNLTIVGTSDGSPTLRSGRFQQHYHSLHGAIQESNHVFIQEGLQCYDQKQAIRILEIGFGTGLNALLTHKHRSGLAFKTEFISYEAFPIDIELATQLNYGEHLGKPYNAKLLEMHKAPYDQFYDLSEDFSLLKRHADILDGLDENEVDLVFFDAFSPGCQPELWSVQVFSDIIHCMKEGGILTTYCSKGDVRRAMLSVGFKVEKCPGPPGKREMLRAIK